MPILPDPGAQTPVADARRVLSQARETVRRAVISVEGVAADCPDIDAGVVYDTRAELRHIADTLGDLLARFEDLS